MKNLIFTFSLFVSVASFAQDFEQNMVEVYGQTYYDNLEQNNPGVISYLENFFERGLELHPYNEKYSNADLLVDIPLRSKNGGVVSVEDFLIDMNGTNFNPLRYNFNSQKEVQIFRLNGQSQVLIIHSIAQIKE